MRHDDDEAVSDWGAGPICTEDTTIEELEPIIAEQAARVVRDLASRLAHDHDFTDKERDYVIARAIPIITASTREALVAGWLRLQSERCGLVGRDA